MGTGAAHRSEALTRPAQQLPGLPTLLWGHRDGFRKRTLGRASVNSIEILGGVNEGDKVILSDMSSMDSRNRIRLN